MMEHLFHSGIDGVADVSHDGFAMTTPGYERERRSSRAFLRVRLVAVGKNRRGKHFRQVCESVVASEHGGLLSIAQEVEMGADLTVTNISTQEDVECRVVFLGDESPKGWRVGIEFLTPTPRFWGIEFSAPPASNLTPASQEK
jgi:hypothetical protein